MLRRFRELFFKPKIKQKQWTLELPETMRIALPNEVPMDEEILSRIEDSKTANIVEGYTIFFQEDDEEASKGEFEFFAEINIDNSRLWELFIEMSSLLPDEVTLISAHIDDEVFNYGTYAEKVDILLFLSLYKKELMLDTFIKFGLLYHTDDCLTELYVDEAKYIKYWGSDLESFEMIMNKFGLTNIPDLDFIDNFPKTRQVLSTLDEDVTDTETLLRLFEEEYK